MEHYGYENVPVAHPLVDLGITGSPMEEGQRAVRIRRNAEDGNGIIITDYVTALALAADIMAAARHLAPVRSVA